MSIYGQVRFTDGFYRSFVRRLYRWTIWVYLFGFGCCVVMALVSGAAGVGAMY